MISCDCSIDDVDAFDEGPSHSGTRRARKAYECCECQEMIEPGIRYEYASGVCSGGGWWQYRTCLPCVRIRNHYCPHGYAYGSLAEQIEECIGFDYRRLPEGDGGRFDGNVELSQSRKAE